MTDWIRRSRSGTFLAKDGAGPPTKLASLACLAEGGARSVPLPYLLLMWMLVPILLSCHRRPEVSMVVRMELVPPEIIQGHTLSARLLMEDSSWIAEEIVINGKAYQLYDISSSSMTIRRTLIGVASTAHPGQRDVLAHVKRSDGTTRQLHGRYTVLGGTYPFRKIRLTKSKKKLITKGLMRQETQELKVICEQEPSAVKMWQGLFMMPTKGRLTASFGVRRSYGVGGSQRPHLGVDIANKTGTVVVAPEAGIVVFSGDMKAHGGTICIDHGHSVISYYYHLSKRSVSAGERVEQQDVIGAIGAKGLATGPHLHWGMAVNRERVDPIQWTERYIE